MAADEDVRHCCFNFFSNAGSIVPGVASDVRHEDAASI